MPKVFLLQGSKIMHDTYICMLLQGITKGFYILFGVEGMPKVLLFSYLLSHSNGLGSVFR